MSTNTIRVACQVDGCTNPLESGKRLCQPHRKAAHSERSRRARAIAKTTRDHSRVARKDLDDRDQRIRELERQLRVISAGKGRTKDEVLFLMTQNQCPLCCSPWPPHASLNTTTRPNPPQHAF